MGYGFIINTVGNTMCLTGKFLTKVTIFKPASKFTTRGTWFVCLPFPGTSTPLAITVSVSARVISSVSGNSFLIYGIAITFLTFAAIAFSCLGCLTEK
ncbi:hypothetical protein NUACC21_25500 [Scytonema sp. NUACC21]